MWDKRKYQINSLYEVLKVKQNFQKKTVTGKTPFFVIGSFCIPHSICLSIGFWQSSFVYKCCVFNLSTERSNHSFLSVWWITFFKHIYSLTIECREIDWLCKQHMKKVRSSQASIAINSSTELSITVIYVSIVKSKTKMWSSLYTGKNIYTIQPRN